MRLALSVILLLAFGFVAASCGGDSGSGGVADGTPGASASASGQTTNGGGVPEGEDPPGEFGPSTPRVICLDEEGNQRPCTREEVEDVLREHESQDGQENAGAGDANGSTEDVPDEDPDASLGPAQPHIICSDARGNRRSCTPEEVDEILHGGEPAAQRTPGGGQAAPETEEAPDSEDPVDEPEVARPGDQDVEAEDPPPGDQDVEAEPAEGDDAAAAEEDAATEADGP